MVTLLSFPTTATCADPCSCDTARCGMSNAPLRTCVTARTLAYCPGRRMLPGFANAPAIQRHRELGLSIKYRRIVKSMTVEIVEHDPLRRCLRDAPAAACHDDAPGAVAHEIQQLVHQNKVTNMIAEKLKFDSISRAQCWWTCHLR